MGSNHQNNTTGFKDTAGVKIQAGQGLPIVLVDEKNFNLR
jgi:hypothetical protein